MSPTGSSKLSPARSSVRDRDLPADVRMLLAVRVVVVTSLLLAALIIQFTADIVLPINYIYLITGLTYGLTLVYIVIARMVESRVINLYAQFFGDVVLETLLVYFTGGADSPFSFLYLVSIITASMTLYRKGGLVISSVAVILYGVLVDLMFYKVIPMPPQTVLSPTAWTATRIYLNMTTNFAGFYATALLTTYLSEKLRETYEELDVNRQNLAELRALNENVVESIPSGVLTLTPDGTVTFANTIARKILALQSYDMIGRNVAELGLFDDVGWFEMERTVSESGIVSGEKETFDGDDATCIGYTITPLNTLEGQPSGVTVVIQDLTEMKRLEAQLRMKDRMAAVGELSAGIAHEIRNPLAAISGSVQALKSSERLLPHEQRLMSIILKESDRLNRSIADFLRFVRPKETVMSSFDIAASLQETLDLLRNSSEVLELHQIVTEIDPASQTIFGDPNQIRQVFWNVAKNAIQAMPEGGRLTVTTRVDDGRYRIHFADSGKGMSQDDQRRLFQPFRTNMPSGTGLGMAISYRIIQEHDGAITVDSQLGKGTTITISIPVVAHRHTGRTVESASVG